MKQFLGKITLEQVINNVQVLLLSMAKKGGEMESLIFNLYYSFSTVVIQHATLIFNGPCIVYNIY
jgi:hypothetical protein